MSELRVHSVTHVSYESVGTIGEWIGERSCHHSSTALYTGEQLPQIGDFDLLVVMGGPMSANDEARYPWVRDEKRLIEEAITQGKSILGICLGAQLIASTLGARVYPNPVKEIGWFPVELEPRIFAGAKPRQPVFHWHGETFDLPKGAERIASNEACLNQAFRFGERVYGLQFHLEMSLHSVEELIAHAGTELTPARFVQSAEEIRAAAAHLRENRLLMQAFLDRFLGRSAPAIAPQPTAPA